MSVHTLATLFTFMITGGLFLSAEFQYRQWRTQEFCSGGGSTNSVEDRENRDLGAVAP